ncbi:hypothetical protein PQR62_19725 [Herbaspirillum lusitanum]|uniref:Pilus assembly protein PilP n=1 Tax=Herbaspirillum lusitanum TaxID=213312 RepID=A0ABW9ADE2_9BURK
MKTRRDSRCRAALCLFAALLPLAACHRQDEVALLKSWLLEQSSAAEREAYRDMNSATEHTPPVQASIPPSPQLAPLHSAMRMLINAHEHDADEHRLDPFNPARLQRRPASHLSAGAVDRNTDSEEEGSFVPGRREREPAPPPLEIRMIGSLSSDDLDFALLQVGSALYRVGLGDAVGNQPLRVIRVSKRSVELAPTGKRGPREKNRIIALEGSTP